MSAPEEPKPKEESDSDVLSKALELELIMKRASWQKMRERRASWRALSFLFLFFVLLGALLAYFYFSTQMSRRSAESPSAQTIESRR
jgi:hypothetical protein